MTQTDTEALLEALHGCIVQGQLAGCEIEYWTGGGQPPPYYRSDQFRLHTVDGRDVAELAKPRYDVPAPSPEGGYPVERDVLTALPEHVRAVAQMIVVCGVFTEHFAEEQNPRVADILSTEVIVRVGGHAFSRRYFRRVPEALEPLRTEVERITREVVERGERGVYHQGRLLMALPPGPPT
jgi:hypothetical protein